MRKIVVWLLVFTLIISSAAMASDLENKTKEELIAIIEELLGDEEAQSEEAETPQEVPEQAYTELERGSKGDDVKNLQQRLKDLGYLSGAVDGDYGGGTSSAVSSFQNQAGLAVTGKADVETQEALFAADAPKAIVYESLDYKGVSRNPSDYTGKYVKFDGKVLQVIEEEGYVSFRIASRGNYDDVVYVSMAIPENYSRILEDDKVTVSGVYMDLMTYETIMGASVTIPWIMADLVTLR